MTRAATPNHALQRTAPRVTGAASAAALPPTAQPPRPFRACTPRLSQHAARAF